MVFIIVIVAIIIVFIVLGTLIEGDPSDSKTVKYERPKTKPIFSEKVNIDRKESNAKRILIPALLTLKLRVPILEPMTKYEQHDSWRKETHLY